MAYNRFVNFLSVDQTAHHHVFAVARQPGDYQVGQ